jgi:hypothetical protein
MGHDTEYFRRRAAEARSAAFTKDCDSEHVEVSGHLALAYSALARRRGMAAAAKLPAVEAVDTAASVPEPLMLRD